MDQNELNEQFEQLYQKGHDLSEQLLHRSSLRVFMEAKRFAKTNRLLIPYIYSCFCITNDTQNLYEPEIGIDNAMEMIALLESPDKARKFQYDYDEGHYEYLVHELSSCAYDNLAVHTALRLGYNSPTVFGAVDDGIHVCRRTEKLECVECFREYATRISMASGDYEMGEHYARLCAVSSERENTDDRRYVGYHDLLELFMFQGKFQAAYEILDQSFNYIETYHTPAHARLELALSAERLFLLSGQEDKYPDFLGKHGYDGIPCVPTKEENAYLAWYATINEAIKSSCHQSPLAAAQILADLEHFLLVQDVLNPWFPVRVARIANLLMAQQSGQEVSDSIKMLSTELRTRATESQHWSAIKSLNAMTSGEIKLNPLGIAYPIDIGPYATPGTKISAAHLEWSLPLFETEHSCPAQVVAEENNSEVLLSETLSPLEQKAAAILDQLNTLWEEKRLYETECQQEQEENSDATFPPYAKQQELLSLEQSSLEQIMAFTPDQDPPLTIDEFLSLCRPFQHISLLNDLEQAKRVWKWMDSFSSLFKGNPRYLSTCSLNAHFLRENLKESNDLSSSGLPDPETILQWSEQAFEKDPQNAKIATIAGFVHYEHAKYLESRRYFTRACQLDRLNEMATLFLSRLYEYAERPQDAMATIDLYTRAGGRNALILNIAMDIAFHNDMPNEFLLYYNAFSPNADLNFELEAKRFWALMKTSQFDEALILLDTFDSIFKDTTRDRLFLRALCLAKTEKNWIDCFSTAIELGYNDSSTEGLLGMYYDPCQDLWDFVSQLSEENPHRGVFVQFLFERGLVPNSLLDSCCGDCSCHCHESDHEEEHLLEKEENDETQEDNDELEMEAKPLYRCFVKQPLDSKVPAFDKWVAIPCDVPSYNAIWLVLADNEEEAIQLVLASQRQCYPLEPSNEVLCEQVDAVQPCQSMTIVQGPRQWLDSNDEQDSDEE